mgnify:CR=1 FL=1
MMKATRQPKRMEGRWKAFAVFRSEPGITGITVARAATGPPVRKYWMRDAPEAAAKAAANGSAPVPRTTCRKGTSTATEAA